MAAETPTNAVPTEAIKLAGTVAVSCPALTKLVLRDAPFQVTTVAVVKPEPLAVRVNAGPPATAVLGEMLVSVSAGALMVKISVFEVWLLLFALIEAEPASAIRFAGTVTEIWPELIDSVERDWPFQKMPVLESNAVPLTVSVNEGPPAVADGGKRLVSVRAGLIANGSGVGRVDPARRPLPKRCLPWR